MDSRDSGFEVGPEMLAIAAAIPSITEASRIRVDPPVSYTHLTLPTKRIV